MLPDPTLSLGDVRLDPHLRRSLARRLRRVAQRVGVAAEVFAALSVRIVDDVEMTRLHEEHLGEPGTTDVMSFPAAEIDGEGPELLGDVVVCWDAVRRQARSASPQDLLDEATILLVHGFVHLLGHDHAAPGEGRAMHRVEARLLRGLGVPDVDRPYARGVSTDGRSWS